MATVPVRGGTNLRRTGELDRDNKIGTVDKGDYEALHQCVGDRVTEGDDTNTWWVKIKAGNRQGWVSAVRITIGGNDEPIRDVPQRPVEWA